MRDDYDEYATEYLYETTPRRRLAVHRVTGPEPDWNQGQRTELEKLREWLHSGTTQLYRLFGDAGTGKTTLAKYILPEGLIAFCAYSNKASYVMRRNGCTGAGTIDGLIYMPMTEIYCKGGKCENPPCEIGQKCPQYREKWVGRSLRDVSVASSVDLIVVDECSMVDEEMGKDLCSFGKKIVVLGDGFQLPPPKGKGYFTEVDPDGVLTEIQRQQKDSPVIILSQQVRHRLNLVPGRYENSRVMHAYEFTYGDLLKFDQVLVGAHTTRMETCKIMRNLLGYHGNIPQAGEKLVLHKNFRDRKMYNGSFWKVVSVGSPSKDGNYITMEVVNEDDPTHIETVNAPLAGFWETNSTELGEMTGDAFALGYAITVHKSQGSQWKSVGILDDSWKLKWGVKKRNEEHLRDYGVLGTEEFDAHRWLYTGITRACDDVTVLLNCPNISSKR